MPGTVPKVSGGPVQVVCTRVKIESQKVFETSLTESFLTLRD